MNEDSIFYIACVCVGALICGVYLYLDTDSDTKNSKPNVEEKLEYNQYIVDSITQSITNNEFTSCRYATTSEHVNLLHLFHDFVANGNNTSFVISSFFIFSTIFNHYKPLVDHPSASYLDDYYFDTYCDVQDKLKTNCINKLKEKVDQVGFIDLVNELEWLNKNLDKAIFSDIQKCFNKSLYLKENVDVILCNIPLDLPLNLSSNEIISIVKSLNFRVSTEIKNKPHQMHLIKYAHSWSIIQLEQNERISSYNFKNVVEALDELSKFRNLALNFKGITSTYEVKEHIKEDIKFLNREIITTVLKK